jgi:hypothetical protein
MGRWENVVRRMGLITVPHGDNVTLTWDTLDMRHVVMPEKCSGDPAHGPVAAETTIPGKRVKIREVEAMDKDGTPGFAVRVLFFLIGVIFLTRPRSSQPRRLVFDHSAPYCAQCYQGIRRTQRLRVVAALILVSSSLLCCPLASLVESNRPGAGQPVFVALLVLGSILSIILLFSSLVLRGSDTIRIVNFSSEGDGIQIVLEFRNRHYADLFLLDNSIRALSNDTRAQSRKEAACRLAQLNNPAAIEPLTRLLQEGDESPEVLACAEQTLASLSGNEKAR